MNYVALHRSCPVKCSSKMRKFQQKIHLDRKENSAFQAFLRAKRSKRTQPVQPSNFTAFFDLSGNTLSANIKVCLVELLV